jgi:hypothetical protein
MAVRRRLRQRAVLASAGLLMLAAAGAPLMAQSGGSGTGTAALNVPWAPLAPESLTTVATGPAGGRVLSVAVDPSDSTGNTIYIGTTGGVFKSINAAASSGVAFVPATDLVPAVDVAHTHINLVNVGAVSVQPGRTGVVLAGTGDPTHEPDSLYGTGILRSTDGGNSWTAITGSRDAATGLEQDSFFGEAFAGFVWSTAKPNLVVAAVTTAPGAYTANAGHTGTSGEDESASGLYYSDDAGATWQLATITDGQYKVLQAPGQQTGVVALAVVWNPMRGIFVAALRNHGFYSSPDGVTWTRLASQPGTALGRPVCPPSPSGSPNCPIYSAALAVEPGSGDMFALMADQNDKDRGLWEDVCGASGGTCSTQAPVFAKQIGANALETGSGLIAGASHALWLQAIPSGNNDTLLFAGTQDLFRCSLAAGCVWRNATNVNTCPGVAQVGPNQHGVAWVANTTTLFFANDRGLWRTRDAVNQQQAACSPSDAAHFDNLNGTLGSLAEVTSLAQDPADASQLLAGSGAAGTAGGRNGAWQLLLSGPGGGTAAGWGANAGTWFATSGAGVSIRACTLGASCGPTDFGSGPVIGNPQVSGDGSALSAPAVWTLDPEDPTRMLVATCRVWRGAADGTNWTAANALSRMLDGNNAAACQSSNTQVRALAATGAISGRGDQAERIYVGLVGAPDGAVTRAGHLLTALVTPSSVAGSTAWSDVTGSTVTNDPTDAEVFNRAQVGISAIAVDATDTTGKTVYVGIGGFGGQGFAPLAWSNVPGLYGSTDAGSTWQNVANNLPNAPVNAVLVDPEDPAIVYVGTDVGVYVTTSVTQCADVKQNCWSIYGAGLPAVRVTTLSAVDTGGEKWLRAGTKGRGVWQAELASTALKTSTATATILPATLIFAAQAVATTSGAESLTIQNTGAIALTLGAPTVSSSDFVVSNQCPATLAPAAGCAFSIVFAPTATGQRSGTVTMAANVQGGVLTANVQGVGTQQGTMVVTPLRLDFGSVRIGQTSPVQYVTVANTGTKVAGLKPLNISGPFTITANTCGLSLAVNTSCTVGVVFSPAGSGAASGSLVATDDAGTQTALLSGNGQTGPTDALSTSSLTFAAQAIGTTSAAQQVTVTNGGDSALTNIKLQLTGDFAVTNLCGIALPGHSTCALEVVYSPKAVGAERGQMAIQDALGAQVVVLNGTGIPPASGGGVTATLSPLTIDFGIQGVNSISSPQTLTVINTGTGALSGIAVGASQGFAIASNACTVAIAPGASCTVTVTFAPQVAGTQDGAVQVTASGASAPFNVPVTGVGADFQLSVQGASSSTITGGSSATYQLLLTPLGASAGPITFACTGTPAGSTCSTNPANVTMTGTGATATIQVTVVTAAASARTRPASLWDGKTMAGAFLACLVLWRRRRWAGSFERYSMLLVLGAICLGLTGCGLSINGGAGTTPGSSSSGQGVYTITVAAGAPGVSHSVTLNLTVE